LISGALIRNVSRRIRSTVGLRVIRRPSDKLHGKKGQNIEQGKKTFFHLHSPLVVVDYQNPSFMDGGITTRSEARGGAMPPDRDKDGFEFPVFQI